MRSSMLSRILQIEVCVMRLIDTAFTFIWKPAEATGFFYFFFFQHVLNLKTWLPRSM